MTRLNTAEEYVHKLDSDTYVVAKWHRGFNYWFTSDVNPFPLLVDRHGNKTVLISDLPKNLPQLGARLHSTKQSAIEAATQLYMPSYMRR